MSAYRRGPFRDMLLAIATLTIIPVHVTWPEGERTDVPGYYPLVGFGLGWIALMLLRLVAAPSSVVLFAPVKRAPLVVSAGAVAFFALSTRMLHWDGLGDVFDAIGAPDRERRLQIMRDSAIGSFGVTAIALCVVAQTAALGQLISGGRTWAVVAVPVFGRLALTFAAWFGRPARPGGLGASVIGRPRVGAVIAVAVVVGVVIAASIALWGAPGVWLSVGGVVLALGMPHVLAIRFGGVTGDVMGASLLLVETLLYGALAVAL